MENIQNKTEEKKKGILSDKWTWIVILFSGLIVIPAIVAFSGYSVDTPSQPQVKLTPEQQEEVSQAKIKSTEEEQKRKEEEEKANAQAEEDKRNAQAEKYCSDRKDVTGWYFPLFSETAIVEKNNGSKSYSGDYGKKKGSQLTKIDCREIVDFMYKWGVEKKDDVIDRKYWIGMSKTELMLSVGLPNDINKENYGNRVREQWIYPKDSYGINAYYFYIENDKVTAYQDY